MNKINIVREMNNNLKPTEQHVRYHQQSSEGTTSSVEQGFRPFNLDVKSLAPEILSLGLWLVNPPCAIGEQVSQTHNINGQHKYLRERTTSNRKKSKSDSCEDIYNSSEHAPPLRKAGHAWTAMVHWSFISCDQPGEGGDSIHSEF